VSLLTFTPENPMLTRVTERLKRNQAVRIVCYGDSISNAGRMQDYHGGASCFENNWGQQLWNLLLKEFPQKKIVVENFGIGGQNAYEGLGRMDGLGRYNPDLVLIEFGANDCGWHELPPSATALAIRTMVQGIRHNHGADIVVLGVGGDNPKQPKMQHIEETLEAVRTVASETSAPFVDIRAAVLKATNNGEKWEQYHNGLQDCHPNDKGMTVWAEAVFEVLKREIG
jgi:lysophospholipase L1-like esterase